MTVSLCIVSNTQKVSNWHACNKYHLKRNKYCLAFPMNIWVKVFKNRQSKICRRLRPYHFNFFKDCLPQILLSPLLNNLTDMI